MRQQAVDATRAAVLSQRNARIGNNQFLKRQYGMNELGGQPMKPAGATHTGVGSADHKKHYLDAQGNDLGLAE
jgi:hypothetical protein